MTDSMFTIYRKEIEWAGRPLTLETGQVARQADGAVICTYGGTKVLCAATADKSPTKMDFFPLTVHYLEKTYAAGKIPGGFFKREAKPSEKEVLTSRLIDRPIRPLFADWYNHDTQVICTVLSHDGENDPEVPAMIGASAALTISGLPFMGPIAGVRIAYIDGKYVVNPTNDELEDSRLLLSVAGTKEGVLMVESEAQELTEEEMLGAVTEGHKQCQPVIDAIIELAESCAKDPWEKPEADDKAADALRKKVSDLALEDLKAAYGTTSKQERTDKLQAARAKVVEALTEEDPEIDTKAVTGMIKKMESELVRGDILKNKKRIDGRGTADVRQIASEVGFIPRTHGSALFTRGETQALCVATLGTGQDEQIVDALDGEYRESFMLHYNFPPYSVGEAGRMGPPGRREIGHGKLAFRALSPMMPEKMDFPYTIRIVSEITESNGSSSMATVCGSSLAMMDAGVPVKKPVAGIAMGLIKEGKDFAVLSDIMGDEDHLGDMDFKVAGTDDGITALQMDIKITSITQDIMKQALEQAKDGRLHILGEMSKALSSSRDGISEWAPQVTSMTIPTDKIRDVIGSGGKMIREICEVTGSKVDIEDDGSVRVAAVDREGSDKAVAWIKAITESPEVGKVYKGTVVNVVDFGAFVRFWGGRDGLVHISELKNERVNQVTDVVKEGEDVLVKMIGFDRGKIKLSIKQVEEGDEGIEDPSKVAAADQADEEAEAAAPLKRKAS